MYMPHAEFTMSGLTASSPMNSIVRGIKCIYFYVSARNGNRLPAGRLLPRQSFKVFGVYCTPILIYATFLVPDGSRTY